MIWQFSADQVELSAGVAVAKCSDGLAHCHSSERMTGNVRSTHSIHNGVGGLVMYAGGQSSCCVKVSGLVDSQVEENGGGR